MRRFQIAGARGGQGTTTVATVVAALAGHIPTTLSATRPDDGCALAATASTGAGTTALVPDLTQLTGRPDWSDRTGDARVAVEDVGRVGDPASQRAEKAPGTLRSDG